MAVSAPPETTLKVPRAPLGCLDEKLWLFKKQNKARLFLALPWRKIEVSMEIKMGFFNKRVRKQFSVVSSIVLSIFSALSIFIPYVDERLDEYLEI